MRQHITALLSSISVVIAPTLSAQKVPETDEMPAGLLALLPDDLDEEAIARLLALGMEAQASIEGVEPIVCPTNETTDGADVSELAEETEGENDTGPIVDQDYDPSPALWKISDDDTVIHLFGTFHVLPEGFRWRTAKLDEIIANADEVVFETSEDDMPILEDSEDVEAPENFEDWEQGDADVEVPGP